MMAEPETADKPVEIKTNAARAARGPGETSRGDTLVPMLIGGLVLIIVAMIIVAMMV